MQYSIKDKSYANRGMNLEEDINITNAYYIDNDIALIYKKPTPIKITKVDYNVCKIKEAFFASPSTLDYNGLFKGKYIEFDAKETKNKNSFPIANIHKHQLNHIEKANALGGIIFLIVRFSELNKDYLLMSNSLLNFIENNSRKSIPIEYFEEEGHLIQYKYCPRLDYLEIIRKLI